MQISGGADQCSSNAVVLDDVPDQFVPIDFRRVRRENEQSEAVFHLLHGRIPKVPVAEPTRRSRGSSAAPQQFNEDMTMDAIGRKHWAIAEGHIPSQSSFSDRALISHETACILNAGGSDAHVALTVFFTDRDPVGPYPITVPARRTLHLRFNDLTEPSPVPRDTDFSSLFDSDVSDCCSTHTARFTSRRGKPAVHD